MEIIKKILNNVSQIILICLLFYSCCTNQKHNRYRLAKENCTLQYPTLIRTDGVYIDNFKNNNISYFRYYRFYKSGHFFMSNLIKGNIIDSILRITTNGQKTYFCNKGNNFTFDLWECSYNTGYSYNFGVVDSTKMYLKSYRYRGLFSDIVEYPKPFVYKFYQLDSLSNADW